MDTRKFGYLETIREIIEHKDFEKLKDYVEMIRHKVKNDNDFEDIFLEIHSGKYPHVISMIDDLIYEEMQKDFAGLTDDGDEEDEIVLSDEDIEKFGLEMDFEDELDEEVSFESFEDENFPERSDDDNY